MIFNPLAIYFGLCSCLICGSFFVEEEFCQNCIQKIQQRMNYDEVLFRSSMSEVQFRVATLFDWIPEESDHLSRFFLEMKGPTRKKIWRFFANHFLKQRMSYTNPKATALVPCPSKTNRPDHAYFWAEALAEIQGGTLAPSLRFFEPVEENQRSKNRIERWSFHPEIHVKFTLSADALGRRFESESQGSLVIFADDIITTGATAVQAYLALNRPKNFMVWCLGRRGSLAKNGRFW